MLVTPEFQKAVADWLKKMGHKRYQLAKLTECDPATITRILKQPGKRLDDAIAERICSLIGYDVPEIDSLFRKMLDCCDCGLGCFSEGRVLYINAAMAKMFGKTPEELLGKDATELVRPEHREMVINRIMARDPQPYEIVLPGEDGNTRRFRIVPKMLTSHLRFVQACELPS